MIMENIFSNFIDNFTSFYGGLDFYGLIIFYTVVTIIIILMIILIILEKRNGDLVSQKPLIPTVEEPNNNVELPLITKMTDDSLDINNITKKIENDLTQRTPGGTTFEHEQEEKAIISYQELLSAVGPTNNISDEDVRQEELAAIGEEKHFNSSPHISPVFGFQSKQPPITKPVSKTQPLFPELASNDFLKALKELKNNLD